MYKVAWHPIYVHDVPENHRFPMEKYELLPLQLKHRGIVSDDDFFTPSPGLKYDYNIHCSDYLSRLNNCELSKKEERASGFKQSKTLVEREYRITNGTIECAEYAMKLGAAFNIAGGTHHAFSNAPEGFCLLNDQAIASMHLIKNYNIKSILIVDLDVHQGNGTAEIMQTTKEVFTLSFHGKNNYPHKKQQSNLDIEFEDNTDDKIYLSQLITILPGIINKLCPEFIFYQAGVDVLATDKLGKLALSQEGCKIRDEIVYQEAFKRNIPIVTTMGGGYSTNIKDIIDAHTNTFKVAQDVLY